MLTCTVVPVIEGTPLSLPEFKGRMLRIAALSGDGGPPESAACQMLALRALANAFGGDVGMHDCVPELLPLLERFDAQPLTKHAQVRQQLVIFRRHQPYFSELSATMFLPPPPPSLPPHSDLSIC